MSTSQPETNAGMTLKQFLLSTTILKSPIGALLLQRP